MNEMNREYSLLFNGITQAIDDLNQMAQRLENLQLAAENYYICRGETACCRKANLPMRQGEGKCIYFPACGEKNKMVR